MFPDSPNATGETAPRPCPSRLAQVPCDFARCLSPATSRTPGHLLRRSVVRAARLRSCGRAMAASMRRANLASPASHTQERWLSGVACRHRTHAMAGASENAPATLRDFRGADATRRSVVRPREGRRPGASPQDHRPQVRPAGRSTRPAARPGCRVPDERRCHALAAGRDRRDPCPALREEHDHPCLVSCAGAEHGRDARAGLPVDRGRVTAPPVVVRAGCRRFRQVQTTFGGLPEERRRILSGHDFGAPCLGGVLTCLSSAVRSAVGGMVEGETLEAEPVGLIAGGFSTPAPHPGSRPSARGTAVARMRLLIVAVPRGSASHRKRSDSKGSSSRSRASRWSRRRSPRSWSWSDRQDGGTPSCRPTRPRWVTALRDPLLGIPGLRDGLRVGPRLRLRVGPGPGTAGTGTDIQLAFGHEQGSSPPLVPSTTRDQWTDRITGSRAAAPGSRPGSRSSSQPVRTSRPRCRSACRRPCLSR